MFVSGLRRHQALVVRHHPLMSIRAGLAKRMSAGFNLARPRIGRAVGQRGSMFEALGPSVVESMISKLYPCMSLPGAAQFSGPVRTLVDRIWCVVVIPDLLLGLWLGVR